MPRSRLTDTVADLGRWASVLALVATLAVASECVGGTISRPGPSPEARPAPVAGGFVYPVGDELDFTKRHGGDPTGFYISDSYLVRRGSRGQRVHLGVDLANGRGGSTVRAIASGVVIVADANARIKVRRAQRAKVSKTVKGRRTTRWVTKVRTVQKWRTGWGNYVVIRHILPDGQVVHSLYGHLRPGTVKVDRGDVVAAGQAIAQIGQTGRASSPHLHLEIRKALRASPDERGLDAEDEEDATVEDRSFALLQTVDPIAFLERHVRHFEDLDPGTWQGIYALAACRDGIVDGDGGEFEPDDSITRADYYAALLTAFPLGGASTKRTFSATREALALAGIVDPAKDGGPGDRLTHSEALELLLRCLDKTSARGRNLASFERDRLCRDFNRVFAGPEAAARAVREARNLAATETLARRKAADAEFAKALRAAKARGAGATSRKRLKRQVVQEAVPASRLDVGFEALAQSTRSLTRAEACLLLASAFRIGHERASALEQAATRVASSTSG